MSGIEWADPPPTTIGQGKSDKWEAIAAELRSRPGQWAKVSAANVASSVAVSIRRGQIIAFRPAGAFDATCRSVGRDGGGRRRFDIYARYIGAPS